MTLREIKEQVMFQTNNDVDDLGDFEPYLDDYVNEGYDLLVEAVAKAHVGSDDYPRLSGGNEVPKLPVWMHRGLADYATWLVYRNGNSVKQNRGMAYLTAFNQMVSKARLSDKEGVTDVFGQTVAAGRFYNIYP